MQEKSATISGRATINEVLATWERSDFKTLTSLSRRTQRVMSMDAGGWACLSVGRLAAAAWLGGSIDGYRCGCRDDPWAMYVVNDAVNMPANHGHADH